MNNKIIFPDYNNSILNVITSILKFYEVDTPYNSIKKLDEILSKSTENIVFIILDGMGSNLLNSISPNNFFVKNKISNVTSVYPSTTTAALNTFYSGKPPLVTGWIAWSQYFKEYGRALDMFPKKDSYTEQAYDNAKTNVFDLLAYKNIFEQIEENNKYIKTYEINPSNCESRAKISIKADNIKNMCSAIQALCENKDNNFIFAYSDHPDKLLHKFGCTSEEVREFILNAEEEISLMCKNLKNSTVIICADHGHNDIEKRYDILDIDEINEYLIMPPTLESRCPTFWVKEDKKKEFEEKFKSIFKDEFILYTKEEFLKENFLGYGKPHNKIDDFIGNYIALSVKNSIIKLGTNISKEKYMKLSTHCGLTENEMIVPLIVKQID